LRRSPDPDCADPKRSNPNTTSKAILCRRAKGASSKRWRARKFATLIAVDGQGNAAIKGTPVEECANSRGRFF
jgi:hypothetical protein